MSLGQYFCMHAGLSPSHTARGPDCLTASDSILLTSDLLVFIVSPLLRFVDELSEKPEPA